MRIGELARKTGTSTATIRYYEQIGLLASPGRAANGYRHYEPGSADRIEFIRDAQAAGLSLADIGTIFEMKAEGESTCGHVVLLLEDHLRSVDRQAAELGRTRLRLQAMLDRAKTLDPAKCLDPNRCQTIEASHEPTEREEIKMTVNTKLSVPEIHCNHCKSAIEGAVGTLEGVSTVEVSIPDATVDVAYDDAQVALDAIKGVIEEQGYAVAN